MGRTMRAGLVGILAAIALTTAAAAETFGDTDSMPTEQRDAARQMLDVRRDNARAQREGQPNAVWMAFGRRDAAQNPPR